MKYSGAAFLVAALTLLGTTIPANGQQGGSSAGTVSPAPGAAKPTKAERKAARKEARAKKNVELKKLEGAGYNPPAGNDSNYPRSIQDAQKKAGQGQGASQ